MATARHPKATFFVQRHLFSGLTSFAELEQKIAALPDEQSRGAAFEVFAEAYLATQRKYDAAQVWPQGSVPLDILKNLGLTQQDQGVDGVLQTLLGQFNAYQIKFRTGRPSLTWRELSTFIGLADSPQIHSRVLLTNCDELPAILNDRQGFFCIRGADLDRLEAGDFRAIEAWLADTAFIAPKKSPQPHQTEALAALLPALQTQPRVSAIMACGTGKTLVALWVAEHIANAGGASVPASRAELPQEPARQEPRPTHAGCKILVLLPSLALLRQTLHEWLRETHLPSLAYLCVCSDPTVKEGIDALTTQQSDLDFQVSTDAASVRSFLDAPFAGVKMIFSTYQSASVVGAAMLPGEAFDFAVFDEAHKTAGREGRNFAFALDDNNLPIRKRLFLTATPRHYNPQKRDQAGEAQLVFSMDNPEVYGPQAYRLTFAEAARRGIICRYKVLISVITSKEVTNQLLQRGEVLIDGDRVQARMVANQIALRHAVDKFGTKRIFTFHRTVRDAREFVEGKSGVRNQLKDFNAYHVNGKMTAAQRERLMREFRNCASGLMSNARCLTEGVDVPAVDMVAFLSPRRSLVDIVQATGRAMRRTPGKETGYVLVPLFVEMQKGESVEEAVTRADFSEVWEVLQTMQEQDDVLAEYISRLAETKGRTGRFDATTLEMMEVIGDPVNLDSLAKSVTALAFDDIFVTWDIRIGELTAYRKLHGNCRVPRKYPANPQLGFWVSNHRQYLAQGQLSPEKIKKLNDVGFIWDPDETDWLTMYQRLVAYKTKHGNCSVSKYHSDKQLNHWIRSQRRAYLKKIISSDHVAKLEALGFQWSELDGDWQDNFNKLEAFKVEHGHCRVPKRFDKKLETWVGTQRQFYLDGKMSKERMAKLEAIGFDWIPLNTDWQMRFSELEAFKAANGHCRVPAKKNQKSEFASWITTQRVFYRTGKLSADRIAKLKSLGFEWEPADSDWQKCFAELEAFKVVHGHCKLPIKNRLWSWAKSQRKLFFSDKLSPDRTAKLEALGFNWKPSKSKFTVPDQNL